MTSIPVEKLPKFFSTQDKLEHLVAYFILGILMKISFFSQNKFLLLKKNSLFLSITIIFFYGMLDEIHQLIIPGRYCDFYDWLFDIIGGISGILIIHFVIKKEVSKKNYTL